MISIIIPVYKVERYLRQCLDSILCQTYRDLDILLIDDGSPDRSGEICEEYATKDNRIRVFHTKNNGLSSARNLGLREAKGEYIGFIDSDDWIEPNMYEILLRRLEEKGTDISICGVWKEYLGSRCDYSICDGIYDGTEAIRILIYDQISNGVWNRLYKKECWTSITFPENHTYEEIATSYKVILMAHSVLCVPERLYHYRMRKDSIVHTPSIKNNKDYWNSLYGRLLFLCKLPEFKYNQEIIEKLEMQVTCAAIQVWEQMFHIPKEQRDYLFLHKISCFVKRHYLLLSGKRDWSLRFRAFIFFMRFASEISFDVLCILRCFYHIIVHRKNIKQNCILFPSA